MSYQSAGFEDFRFRRYKQMITTKIIAATIMTTMIQTIILLYWLGWKLLALALAAHCLVGDAIAILE